jgi:hypothetical protein
VLWADIPVVEESLPQDVKDDDPSGAKESNACESQDPVICPNCGDRGYPGDECRQCGQIIPAVKSTGDGHIIALMPSGNRVNIPCGREVAIGRESDVSKVCRLLEDFDAVSRLHCYVRVDFAGTCITVRDPGSTNRTWVGDDPLPLQADELRTTKLPTRVRLGKSVFIEFSQGEAS